MTNQFFFFFFFFRFLCQIPTVPRLFLGSIGSALSFGTLKDLGIDHVISVLTGFSAPDLQAAAVASGAGIESLSVTHFELADAASADLDGALPDLIDAIETALAKADGGVLVHCFQGVSRSVSAVAGLLIARGRGDVDLETAMELIRSVRPKAQPNLVRRAVGWG